ncbi:MAG: AI-2E family transporter, partial [Gammaproteobacteria bacterium]|nr:AI-2E family transporter [Gammaproteobacteria bacterium]
MDQDNLHFSTASRIVITIASVTVVIAGMRAASSILVPFLMAIFVAIISTPPLFWLQRKGLPMMAALIIVIMVVAGIGFGTAIAVGTSVDEFTRILPSYDAQLRLKLGGLLTWAQSLGVSISTEEFSKYLDPGAAVKLVTSLVNGVGNVLTDAFLVSLAVIFILIETSSFPDKLRAILTNP